MALSDVVSSLEFFNNYTPDEVETITNVIVTAYSGSAIARDMFETFIADGSRISFSNQAGGPFATPGTGTVVFQFNYFDQEPTYIDKDGVVVAETPLTLILHELGHALLDLEDDITLSTDNWDGTNVKFVNTILNELEVPEQRSYVGYDRLGTVLELGKDYSSGVEIDRALALNSDLFAISDFNASGSFNHLIISGDDDSIIVGGSGQDVFHGQSGQDTLDGGSGEDHLHGGTEADVLIGGAGQDILYGDEGQDKLFSGQISQSLVSESHGTILTLMLDQDDDILFGGAGNDSIYSSGGADFLAGGAGDDKFYNLGLNFEESISGPSLPGNPSLQTFIWGGDGADEFHFYGDVEIGIIYINGLDELLESEFVNIDLEKLAEASSSYFSVAPNYIIINPTSADRLFQNDELITGGQLKETELKDPDLVSDLEEETGLDANAGRIVEHETESHITTIDGVNYERFDASTITYTDVEATSYSIYAGGSSNEYDVDVLTETYSGLITNELSMWHEEVTIDDEIRLELDISGFTNGLFGIFYSENPEESLKVTSSVYDVSNHTEERRYVHYDTSADPVPAWEFFGDIFTQVPEDTPPEGSVLISEEEGELKAKLFEEQFFNAQQITFNISNFLVDPNDPDPDNPDNPDGIDPITTEGTSADETQSGGGGHDTLNGAGGDDELNGRGGDDTLNGGEGDDTLNGGNGNDTLYGGEGDDYVYGNDGDDTVIAGTGLGYDEYYGGAGNDTIIFPSTEQGVLVDLSESIAEGIEIDDDYLESIENVVGGSGDDTIIGDDENNILTGAEGDDTLTGGLGEDEFVYNFGDGADTITDFDYTSDRINLSTTAITFSGILAFAQNQGDNVVIELSGFAGAGSSDRIILNNVTVDQLSESNFILAAATNTAPVLDNAFADQSSDEDTAVSFVLSADAFSDADGDTLTLTASLSDNSALPSWLSFDANTRTFSGTPPQDFNGSLDIRVTASDGELEASDTFTLDISAVNDAPVLDNVLADQSSDEDTVVSFVLPADAFSDVEGDALTLSAILADDSALPAWLSFDADTKTFSGTPPQDFNGALDIKVTASDGELEASDTFTLDITSVNDAPDTIDDDGFGTTFGEPIAIAISDLVNNDGDVDGDDLTIETVESLVGGSVAIDGDNIIFTPNSMFYGKASFNYTLSDGRGGTSTASVGIQVAAPLTFGTNLVNDGNFEDHGTLNRGGWGTMEELNSWTSSEGVIEVQTKNYGTGNSDGNSVIELDAHSNATIETSIRVEETGNYIFSLDYAMRGSNVDTNGFNVSVNGEEIAHVHPDTFGFKQLFVNLNLEEGEHVIQISGDGTSDSYGTVIDNVALMMNVPFTLGEENISNGTFEDHPLLDRNHGGWGTMEVLGDWTSPTGSIEIQEKDYQTGNEVGNAVVELDSYKNSTISQVVDIEQDGSYYLSFDYAMRGTNIKSNGVAVIVDDVVVRQIMPDEPGFKHDGILIELDAGQHEVAFAALGTSNSYGTVIDDVSLRAAIIDESSNISADVAIEGALANNVQNNEAYVLTYSGSDASSAPIFISNADSVIDSENALISGTDQSDVISGGIDDEHLTGGFGQDTFIFNRGDGRDTITDYDVSRTTNNYMVAGDRIVIDIEGVDGFDDLSVFASEVNGNTVFDFGNGDALILSETKLAALDKDAFTFY